MSEPHTDPPPRQGIVPSTAGDTVLVVSRDESWVRTITDALLAGGVQIESTHRLDHAARHLEASAVDAVLTTLSLPDSTGLSTVQRLCRLAPDVPVVVVAERHWDGDIEQVLTAGAEDVVIDGADTPSLVRHSLSNAIARHRVSTGLRTREARLSAAVAGSDDGLWDWDTSTSVVYYSERFNRILGLPEQELVADPDHWLSRVHADDRQSLRQRLEAQLEGGARNFGHEHRICCPDGNLRWVLARGKITRDLDGGGARLAGSLTDITERRNLEEQLRHRALHDPLTGLTNRMLLTDRVNLALSEHARGTPHFAVLYIDIDRFKRINDQYGHAVGDELLIGIGRRLRHFVRPSDTVARLGGDEFAVLLTKVQDASQATHIAERILALVACAFDINGADVRVTTSIGVAINTGDYLTAEDILHDADVAMYRAKSLGPGRYQVYDPQLHDSAMALLQMEHELRDAVEHEAFVVRYQPIVDLAAGKICGFEALVRWRHPERGLLTPTQFLAVAEDTGLMVPIGWWVMRQGCMQIRKWQMSFPSQPPLHLSVNISCKLLLQTDMIERLLEILHATGLDPESLRLEVQEHGVLEHLDAAAKRLLELRRRGVQLSIDDFGTGYSSLTHLERLRYDALKIDRSFVCSLANGGETRQLVESILAVAGTMGIAVVAEGIETAGQAAALRELHCPHGQGFWFAKPVTTGVAEQLLSHAPAWWKPEHSSGLEC
jgi:diguanylate cyclase (GGDEF)-like protein/PAS domain S-box-containing protein